MRVSIIILALAVAGCCTPTEADRQVLHQTREAGALIEAKAIDPVVKQAGADVRLNSETLAKNLVGQPQNPQPYSPEASGQARKDSDKSHEGSGFLGFLLAVGGTLLGVAGLLPIAQRFLPMLLGGRAAKAAEAVIEGVAKVRAAAKAAPDGKLDHDAILKLIVSVQDDPKVKELISDLAQKAQERLGLKGI